MPCPPLGAPCSPVPVRTCSPPDRPSFRRFVPCTPPNHRSAPRPWPCSLPRPRARPSPPFLLVPNTRFPRSLCRSRGIRCSSGSPPLHRETNLLLPSLPSSPPPSASNAVPLPASFGPTTTSPILSRAPASRLRGCVLSVCFPVSRLRRCTPRPTPRGATPRCNAQKGATERNASRWRRHPSTPPPSPPRPRNGPERIPKSPASRSRALSVARPRFFAPRRDHDAAHPGPNGQTVSAPTPPVPPDETPSAVRFGARGTVSLHFSLFPPRTPIQPSSASWSRLRFRRAPRIGELRLSPSPISPRLASASPSCAPPVPRRPFFAKSRLSFARRVSKLRPIFFSRARVPA